MGYISRQTHKRTGQMGGKIAINVVVFLPSFWRFSGIGQATSEWLKDTSLGSWSFQPCPNEPPLLRNRCKASILAINHSIDHWSINLNLDKHPNRYLLHPLVLLLTVQLRSKNSAAKTHQRHQLGRPCMCGIGAGMGGAEWSEWGGLRALEMEISLCLSRGHGGSWL